MKYILKQQSFLAKSRIQNKLVERQQMHDISEPIVWFIFQQNRLLKEIIFKLVDSVTKDLFLRTKTDLQYNDNQQNDICNYITLAISKKMIRIYINRFVGFEMFSSYNILYFMSCVLVLWVIYSSKILSIYIWRYDKTW